MSVSKRLRYEILRRDNHACRYCEVAAKSIYDSREAEDADGS